MKKLILNSGIRVVGRAVLGIVLAYLTFRLFRKAWIGSTDFSVYWKAARTWMSSSVSPYAYTAETKGFVFKYPPWTLPLFAPFGALPFHVALLVWTALELLCLVYAVRWVIRAGSPPKVAYPSGLALWWIWQDHFYSGQITIFLLALALLAVPPKGADSALPAQAPRTGILTALTFAFSTKMISTVSLLGQTRKLLQWRVVLATTASMIAGTLLTWGYARFQGSPGTLTELFRDWFAAAASGGSELGAHVVRGQLNHGFTAAVLRFSGVDATRVGMDAWVSLSLAAIFSALWVHYSRRLSEAERWAGWLALGVVIHPLAWDHSFVLVYPLCALSIARALRSQDRAAIFLSLLGPIGVGILIPNVIGTDAVKPLEAIGVKSWGTLFCAIGLIRAATSKASNQKAYPNVAPTQGRTLLSKST